MFSGIVMRLEGFCYITVSDKATKLGESMYISNGTCWCCTLSDFSGCHTWPWGAVDCMLVMTSDLHLHGMMQMFALQRIVPFTDLLFLLADGNSTWLLLMDNPGILMCHVTKTVLKQIKSFTRWHSFWCSRASHVISGKWH